MKIIENSEHTKQYSITELEKGEVFRLPTAATVYIKIGASDTTYNNVNLADGTLGSINEDYSGLLKVEGAFVEKYNSDDDTDSVKKQLVAKQEQCTELWDAAQSLKEKYWKLERSLEEQEKQLTENQKTIDKLKADRAQLQSMCDDYQTKYAEIEKAYKNAANDFDNLLRSIIDAAYLGEMKGLEGAIMENPQRLIDKIRRLANAGRPCSKENITE